MTTDYARALERYQEMLASCQAISRSNSGRPSRSPRHYWASVLFTTLCVRGTSLLILLPGNHLNSNAIGFWDYAAVGMLTRSLFELRLALYYLCVEDCSESEWRSRIDLMHLHDCVTRQRMFEEMPEGEDQVTRFEEAAAEIRSRLERNEWFAKLATKRRRHLLRGHDAIAEAWESIASRAGTDIPTFRWLHRFLSNQAHGYPMAFHRSGPERGRGLHSPIEEFYTTFFLQFCADLLREARSEFEGLFGLDSSVG